VIDYTIYYKRRLSLDSLADASSRWTLFISAYNDSERVKAPFAAVASPTKHWLIHREYQFTDLEGIDGPVFAPSALHETDFWDEYLAESGADLAYGEVCVDSTGFMRPHLAFLVVRLQQMGVRKVHFLYTDPERYERAERTQFTKGPVTEVRQIAGFEGTHSTDVSSDLLVIGAGYDHELIRRVAESKEYSRKLQLFGLPSLQPSMYQESVISASGAAESLGASAEEPVLFAPANDPFVTAQVLRARIEREMAVRPITNLYLSALGTKPQVLGFALYFATERIDTATSMIFPYAERYTQESSKGISRIWQYTMELPPRPSGSAP
jgi:hypothetical protein